MNVGGAILSLDTPVPASGWRWAGPEWPEKIRTEVVQEITAVEIQSDEPVSMARRWADVLGRDAVEADKAARIDLDRGAIRFVEDVDGRGVGVSGFDVTVADEDVFFEAARRRRVRTAADHVVISGARIYPRHTDRSVGAGSGSL